MKRNLIYRLIMVFLVFLLLLPCMTSASAESGSDKAVNLSRHLKIEQGGGHASAREKLIDEALDDTIPYAPFETIRLSWSNSPKKPAYLCIQWGVLPDRVRIRQTDADGALLSDAYAERVFDAVIPLSPAAKSMTISADASGMELARLALFSAGTLPAPFFPWQDTPKGMDYLIVSTHPDDDVLFMGGIIPTYGVERGYVGTVAYVVIPSRKRVNEANLCARAMGAICRPLFLGFQDVNPKVKDKLENRFSQETVTLAFVRMLREYRPLVVFSHDVNGEYGHWQHKVVAAAIVDACRFAADPSYDALSYAEFGAWEVKKCYLHLYERNPLVMDIRTPLSSMGGRTAFQVAQDAFKLHKSQQNGRHIVESETGRYPINRFGMAYGTVEAGSDVFDNIDPSLFAANAPQGATPTPVPTPEPTPEPTAEPTETPTAEPTDVPATETAPGPTPVPEATPAATPLPAPSPAPDEPEKANESNAGSERVLVPVLCALGGAAAASGCFLLFGRRKRCRKRR